MRPAYRAILRLYPAEHQATFGPEMIETFEEAAAERGKQGKAAFVRFAVWELAGLVRGLWSEWMAKWSDPGGYVTAQCLPESESNLPPEVLELEKQLQTALRRMEFAIAHHDFPNARFYSNEERETREKLRTLVRVGRAGAPASPRRPRP
jgi:hypothetical protein